LGNIRRHSIRNRNNRPITYEIDGNGCYICTSHWCTSQWYPRLSIKDKTKTIVRFLWENKYGPIPKGLVVRHLCNNPMCINLEHIRVGTQKENIHDQIKVGTFVRGEKNGHAKLTEKTVRSILANHIDTNIELAEKYNVSMDLIYQVRKGMIWQHVRGDRQLIGHARGEKQGCAKLTWAQVRELRDDSELSQRALGKIYGVSHHAIGSIKRRKTWIEKSVSL